MVELKRNILKCAIKRSLILPKLFFNDIIKKNRKIYSTQIHLSKAIKWLLYAQEMTSDGGVASNYSLLLGWGTSYPETSGYTIPTLIDYYNLSKNKIYLEKSKEIANWECSIQLEDGGFRGDVISKSKQTTIFNTGQVLIGLSRAYRELKDKLYLSHAIKAGNFLVKAQDEDGNWRKHCFNNIYHTYNVRVAWALLELFQLTKIEKYKFAAIKNLNWALVQINNNYWFQYNSFKRKQPPLLHTISYAIRGFLESGIILQNKQFKDIALNSALKLLEIFKETKFLPATFNSNWQNNDFYSCLTGNAQLSIIWLKLYQISGNQKFLTNAIKLNNYLKSTQIISNQFKDINGAIKGSDPIWGKYNPFSFPNWATKFFCDALMLEMNILGIDDTINI